jgi:hypothetical protein
MEVAFLHVFPVVPPRSAARRKAVPSGWDRTRSRISSPTPAPGNGHRFPRSRPRPSDTPSSVPDRGAGSPRLRRGRCNPRGRFPMHDPRRKVPISSMALRTRWISSAGTIVQRFLYMMGSDFCGVGNRSRPPRGILLANPVRKKPLPGTRNPRIRPPIRSSFLKIRRCVITSLC